MTVAVCPTECDDDCDVGIEASERYAEAAARHALNDHDHPAVSGA